MKEVIKNILDEYTKHSFQVNLDSEASRYALAQHIDEGIKKWQKEKPLSHQRYPTYHQDSLYLYQLYHSEASRHELSEHIEEGIKKWQKENQKKNEA
jgi:hypothetical protein